MSRADALNTSVGRWLVSIVAVLVLYVLSSGPMWTLADLGRLTPASERGVYDYYQPLGWVIEELGLEPVAHSYSSWWYELLK